LRLRRRLKSYLSLPQNSLLIRRAILLVKRHDYLRYGTTTLFAALDVLEGTAIERSIQCHPHQEFIRFLKAIKAEVPVGKVVHAILDNYVAHKHTTVMPRLERNPRFVFRFTRTSMSRLNSAKGYFAKLTRRRPKRGVFHSLVALQAALNRFVAETDADSRPFSWTKDPGQIIVSARRGFQALAFVH
jgi:hypothetical protein